MTQSKKDSPNIFFAVPIRNRAWCLSQYLRGLESLDYPRKKIHIHFLVNDSTDETFEVLTQWGYHHAKEYADFVAEYVVYNRPEGHRTALVKSLYGHFADMKNYLRGKFLASPCEYWLQIDSDSPPRPDTLLKLLRHRKGYVGGTCNVDIDKNFHNSRSLSNVMEFSPRHGTFIRVSFDELEKVPDGKLYPCDWIGGITLIRRDIAAKCHYHEWEQGKDDNLGFCHEVETVAEEQVWCDPSVSLDHFMVKGEVW